MVWSCPFFQILYNVFYTTFNIGFLSQVKDIEKSISDILLLIIWTHNDSNEWNILSIKFMLMNLMVEQICDWWIDFKEWMTMVPCKLPYSIFFHLIWYPNMIFIWNFTVYFSCFKTMGTWFCRIYFTDNNIDPLFFYAIDSNISLIMFTTQKTNNFVFRQVWMNIHEHLNFKCKVYLVWLALKWWESLTFNELVLSIWS